MMPDDRNDAPHPAVTEAIFLDDEHPPVEPDLFAFVDGSLDAARAAAIEQHLEGCAQCREDIADLRQEQHAIAHPSRRRTPVAAWLALTASLALVVITALLWQRPRPRATARYERAEWNTLVHDALARGRVEQPRWLDDLRVAPSVVRGDNDHPPAAMQPAAVVLETDRPELTWPAVRGAATVILFAGDNEVVRSPPLQTNRWTPPHPLPRGVTYTWEVDVRRGDQTEVLPAPPAPHAAFHVISSEAAADLAAARARHASDHLLLGVLYARYGLTQDARRELGAYAAAHPRDARAQALARSLR